MISLTQMWQQAGKPEGRSPSAFKATAAVQRQLAAGYAWQTTGRGFKAVTVADDGFFRGYADYLATPRRGAAQSRPGPQPESKSGRVYTDEEIERIKDQARSEAYKRGKEDGYNRGFEDGVNLSSFCNMGRPMNTGQAKTQCQAARRKMAAKYHPDRAGGDGRDMTIINACFDEVERILASAA